MRSFAIITDTPGRLAAFLESRGIIQKVTDPKDGTYYTGVLPGLEWIEVPNPIMTDPGSGTSPNQPGYIPPTYDTRHVYLVKFAWDSESQKAQGLKDWILANSSPVTAPAGWTINGEPAGDALKITGQNVWLAHVDPDRFGTWQ